MASSYLSVNLGGGASEEWVVFIWQLSSNINNRRAELLTAPLKRSCNIVFFKYVCEYVFLSAHNDISEQL